MHDQGTMFLSAGGTVRSRVSLASVRREWKVGVVCWFSSPVASHMAKPSEEAGILGVTGIMEDPEDVSCNEA